jgi:hypothetical protein
MAIRAVLFDVGGPIDLEIEMERLIDRHIVEAALREGIEVNELTYAVANAQAVASLAANTSRDHLAPRGGSCR